MVCLEIPRKTTVREAHRNRPPRDPLAAMFHDAILWSHIVSLTGFDILPGSGKLRLRDLLHQPPVRHDRSCLIALLPSDPHTLDGAERTKLVLKERELIVDGWSVQKLLEITCIRRNCRESLRERNTTDWDLTRKHSIL